jgi:maltose O-acetyltransferase
MHDILTKVYFRYIRPDLVKKLVKRGLVVGKNFRVQEEVIIDDSHCWHIIIGDDVTLAARVHILAHDASTKRYLNYTRIGKVRIGNRVFIGTSSIILPGVTIGDDVIVGAGSIVTRDIPNGVVSAGNPARVLCSIEEFLSRRRKEMEKFPCFGEEYTLRKNVTDEMKKEMNLKMKDRFGYII